MTRGERAPAQPLLIRACFYFAFLFLLCCGKWKAEEESESEEMEEEEDVAMDPADDGQPTVGPSSKVVTSSGGGGGGSDGGHGFSLDDRNRMKEPLVWQSVGNVSGRAVTFKGTQETVA